MKYRIYIDEVGNPDLESSDDPNHRFLSLTGVIVGLDYVRDVLHPQMEALKAQYFGHHPDDPVILHRKDMLNARRAFRCLRDPGVRRRFDAQLLHLLASWQYAVITVCLDKKNHRETYRTWRYAPYHYCLCILLERYTLFLQGKGACGDCMAESRQGKEDRRLKESFRRLWENGSEYIEAEDFQQVLTSRELKVKPKSRNISGLQLSDLLAHPSRSEILSEERLLGRPVAPFARKVVSILQSKYYQQPGRAFGRKFL